MGSDAMSAVWVIVILVVLAVWAAGMPSMPVVKEMLVDWFKKTFGDSTDRRIQK